MTKKSVAKMEIEKNLVTRIFYIWGGLPWRKPVAMTTDVVVLLMVLFSWILQYPIEPCLLDFLKWFTTAINTLAFGTSLFEAMGEKKEEHCDSEP